MYTSCCWVVVVFGVCVCSFIGGLGVVFFVISVHSFFSFSFLYFALNWYLLLD